jgi:hypothetical protein
MGSSSKEGEVARRRPWATHVADEANLVMNRDHGAGGDWQIRQTGNGQSSPAQRGNR